jgi:hypothetical protein
MCGVAMLQLGGNSLAAGAVCARTRAALQTEHHIPVAWLMQCPTIWTLARRLTDQGAEQKMLQMQPLRPRTNVDSDSSAPLTFQQVLPRWHHSVSVAVFLYDTWSPDNISELHMLC